LEDKAEVDSDAPEVPLLDAAHLLAEHSQ
jgi:hypothetical protein